ncbi:TMEM165/GDT1 family protein [Sphingomonas sp. MMS12-HWE2-04]|uniref:TMEM165/GDT1 family protein n=1 Tax=Sphingomonas sp. MMS12-HWE2-04 TaxID=3234199 RepID=UPI00384CDE5C
MEAIVPAFLLAVLSQIGDRPAALTALLSDRFARPWTVVLAAAIAQTLGNALAALFGAAVAPMLTPEAQSLMLGLALLFGGASGLFPSKPPGALDSWRLAPFFTALLGIFAAALGDRTQFFTFALATRGEPAFAAIGAILGTAAIAFVAATLGESGWRPVAARWPRLGVAFLFLGAGFWTALGALRLL